MKIKMLLSTSLCLAVLLTSFSGYALAKDEHDIKFSPEEVINAIDGNSNSLNMNEIVLPNSMDISVPNIDMEKVKITTPLDEYTFDFKGQLVKHGYTQQQISDFTYSDYTDAEKKWILNDDQIKTAISLYPELKDIDISGWTNGDFEKYYTKVDQTNLEKRFSDEQINILKNKGIRTDDLFYLFKDYYTVDTIMATSDEELKNTIKDYYNFKLKIVRSLANNNKKSSSDFSIMAFDSTKYTSQNMPRYGTDNFLNTVCVDAATRQLESDRTLKEMKVLYRGTMTSFSRSTVQNMYGTYSSSQGGAHEGIDFSYGSTGTTIYAIFNGTVRTPDAAHSTHHLCVYDSSVGKTYSYLHMNSKSVSVGSTVYNGTDSRSTSVGTQGMKGNATGPHVHFEVHFGNTSALASESDHVLQSSNPYQLQGYIGEL